MSLEVECTPTYVSESEKKNEQLIKDMDDTINVAISEGYQQGGQQQQDQGLVRYG